MQIDANSYINEMQKQRDEALDYSARLACEKEILANHNQLKDEEIAKLRAEVQELKRKEKRLQKEKRELKRGRPAGN